jgi:hypothetical protein
VGPTPSPKAVRAAAGSGYGPEIGTQVGKARAKLLRHRLPINKEGKETGVRFFSMPWKAGVSNIVTQVTAPPWGTAKLDTGMIFLNCCSQQLGLPHAIIAQ